MVDVGVDLHKSYSQVAVLDAWGEIRQEQIDHQGSAMEEFVRSLEPGSRLAVEATGNWWWFVDLVESATRRPGPLRDFYRRLLRHKGKAKARVAVARNSRRFCISCGSKAVTITAICCGGLGQWVSPFLGLAIKGRGSDWATLLSLNGESGFEIMSRVGGTNGCLVGGPQKEPQRIKTRDKNTATLDRADSLIDVLK